MHCTARAYLKAIMTKRYFITFLLIHQFVAAQVTIKLASLPKNTPENAGIFIAGNFNNWNPNDSSLMLSKNSKGIYFIDLPTSFKPYQFKFTLGSWASSEMSAGGGDIENRNLFAKRDTTLEISIQNWKSIDILQTKKNAGNIVVLSEVFPMKVFNKTRRIWVYLPQDYTTRLNKTYPVMYMQDGQNLFYSKTAANGEWEIDETLEALENKGDSGIIVVGIDHAGAQRIDEYSPWKNAEYGGGKGDAYLDFIVKELKPVIDMLYRTKPDRAHTALMGSSLGALITLYGGMKYETTFSKIGVFSPALWFSDSIYIVPKNKLHQMPQRIYLMSGILESSTQAQETYNMRDTLYKYGYAENEVRCEIKNDGTHSEWFWKREFEAAYKWLFAGNKDEALFETKPNLDFSLNYLGDKNKIEIVTSGLPGSSVVEVKNHKGRLVAKKHFNERVSVSTSNIGKGVYTVTLIHPKYTGTKSFEKK